MPPPSFWPSYIFYISLSPLGLLPYNSRQCRRICCCTTASGVYTGNDRRVFLLTIYTASSLMVCPHIVIFTGIEFFVCLMEQLTNRQSLRTFTLTGTAIHTFNRPMFSDGRIVRHSRHPGIMVLIEQIQAVQDFRNADTCGASLVCTIMASRAAHRLFAINDFCGAGQHDLFVPGKRLEVLHQCLIVFFHLFNGRHTAEYRQNAVKRSGIPKCPGHRGLSGIGRVKQRFDLRVLW